MQLDTLAVRLRPRSALEAADLGVRLCQSAVRSVYSCYAVVALPLVALALACFEFAGWLPSIVLWCAKPWLDRTILFVLSRAAFGQRTGPADVWRAQRKVWWRQALFTWTIRRLSPWRSLTEPVYQLEEFSIMGARARLSQIRARNAGSALMVTSAFYLAELGLVLALLSLVFWLAPTGRAPDLFDLTSSEAGLLAFAVPLSQGVAILFLEPFYVAAGFGMYLNRRAELEAWDIEQEFRRAFAQ